VERRQASALRFQRAPHPLMRLVDYASVGVPPPSFFFLFSFFLCSPDGAQRNPGAAFKPHFRSRITLRSIRATFLFRAVA
jgi:hypothetical protein